MLDDFKTEQKIAYQILNNAIKNNNYSHAYLIETNGYNKKNIFTFAFAKSLLCPHSYTNKKICKDCFICDNIDKNIYSELKVINPDGMWIKKEQLLDLQGEFKTKSLNSDKKVYIINQADRLNNYAANSILKFLEEPAPGIIAILIADNIHNLLDTIVSRCQIITLSKYDINTKSKIERINDNIEENYDDLEDIVNRTISFIDFYEQNHLKTIIYEKSLFLNYFNDKNKINTFLQLLLLFYRDVIYFKLNKNLFIFEDNDVKEIAKLNSLEQINKKIEIIMNAKEKIKINVNVNLLIDKLIVDLEGE